MAQRLDSPAAVVATIASVERRAVTAAERTYLAEMRTAPFAAYRWSRATAAVASASAECASPARSAATARLVLLDRRSTSGR